MTRAKLEARPHHELVNLLLSAQDRDEQRQKYIDEQVREIKALKNELFVIRWSVRGVLVAGARLSFTLNAHLKPDEIITAMRIFGEQAAHKFLYLAKLAFKGHARQHVMRNYIYYLQNHASKHGVQFAQLGENNYGVDNPWKDDWEPEPYDGPEIVKRELKPLTIVGYNDGSTI